MHKTLLTLLLLTSFAAHSQTVGWFYNNPGASDGYILFAPGSSDTTYLIDKCGKRIHEWGSQHHPGLSVYLLKDGTLIHDAVAGNNQFNGGGAGGIVEKIDWYSNILWSYKISDNTQCQHHDAMQLPNGNILAIAWESHTKADAQASGRVSVGNTMWSDKLVEIQPVGTDSGIIVWQWRAWDHLVQDVDSNKINYGVVKDHPELININIGSLNNIDKDWLHINGLDFDSVHNQILVSIHNLSEVFILDHSTTLDEAASHSGGTSGHGGDILYRWGNPQNYGRGVSGDQKLYQQHNPNWIPAAFPGGGKVIVFNNGVGRPGTDYSTIDEFTIPAMVNNNYPIEPDSAYGPTTEDWIYTANPPTSLNSFVEGGAQRVANGNTFICNATSGEFLEIDSLGNDIWKYINPVSANGITAQGQNPFMNTCFRVTNIPPDYEGLTGQDLTPGGPIELNPNNYTCVDFPTGVESLTFNDGALTTFPNPFQHDFNLHFPADVNSGSLQIHDVTGKLIYELKNLTAFSGENLSINFSGYTGMVFISLKDETGNRVWNTSAIAQ